MQLFKQVILVLMIAGVAQSVSAQNQKLGFYDSEFILQKIPEYAGIQQQLDLLSSQWKERITEIDNEIVALQDDYEAKEILYTDDIRKQKQQEITQKKREKERYLAQKFGPDGEYFTRQQELLEPIQRQIFTAVRAVAEQQNFDFIFDRAGDIYMVYGNNEYNINEDILFELGIDIEE